jgi:circadian clock protein KaiB
MGAEGKRPPPRSVFLVIRRFPCGIRLAKGGSWLSPVHADMRQYQFTLFIAGESPRSQRAIANLKRIAQERLGGDYELIVVDVQQEPERAEEERILTTPTLVKRTPEPRRRVTGDLTNAEQVLIALSLLDDEER